MLVKKGPFVKISGPLGPFQEMKFLGPGGPVPPVPQVSPAMATGSLTH